MRLIDFTMRAYGTCTDVTVSLGPGVTVVLGGNESGKSTALDALSDLLWGIPVRSTRSYVHARGALRIDATIDEGATERVVVRRAAGVFSTDLVTQVANPWDPDGAGSAEWWRARMGLTLDQLRAGGHAVFTGGGDLAEAVFVAREGRSARVLLQGLRERRDALFKGDRRARSVRVREALAAHEEARERRDASVTRSGAVSRQRELVEHLTRELAEARDSEADTDRCVRTAEENVRAIEHVRRILAARATLARIDAEGPRLSDEHLAILRGSSDEAARARVESVRLTQQMDGIESSLRSLVVDDALLLDAPVVDRLRMRAGEQIGAVRRAEEEYAPIVRAERLRLVGLLSRLGVEAANDVDSVASSMELPTPLQADVTTAAEELATAEADHAQALRTRDDCLATLVGRGLVIDPVSGVAPRQDLFDDLRSTLVEERATCQTRAELLAQARSRLESARATGAAPSPTVDVDSEDVLAARVERDAAWDRVRTAWTTGDDPGDSERADWARAVDEAVRTADDMADREASGRALLSAHDARLEARVEGIEAAANDVARAEQEHGDACRRRDAAEQAWSAAWHGLGVPDAPGTDAAPELLGLIATAFEQHALVVAAGRDVDEARGQWQQACVRAELPESTTPAGWHERVAVLSAITESRAARDAAATKEGDLRNAWAAFCAEVGELLTRHGALADALAQDDEWGPGAIERGLELLGDRRKRAADADTERRGLDTRLRELADQRSDVERAISDEVAIRHELAEQYGTDTESGLDTLAERAERAGDPLQVLTDARALLEGALDAGSTPDEVIERLREEDQESVAVTLAAALEAQADAREASITASGERSAALERLRDLESAGSAAEAEAAVAERLGDLVALTEEWSVLCLQVVLLEQTLARMGSDDARPLLDRAGRILERITDGRYLALQADETPTSRVLRVVRADGERMAPADLSEGTADQVFFALRMSAVADLHEQRREAGLPALPLVLDDVLMAFDDARALDALGVLHELADDLQIIVFTHHSSVADAAGRVDGVVVSRLPSPAAFDDPLDGDLVRATVQQDVPAPAAVAPVRGALARDARDERAAARAWAQAQGIPVAARGRLPEEILEQYRASRR